jgi:hypothetical protein
MLSKLKFQDPTGCPGRGIDSPASACPNGANQTQEPHNPTKKLPADSIQLPVGNFLKKKVILIKPGLLMALATLLIYFKETIRSLQPKVRGFHINLRADRLRRKAPRFQVRYARQLRYQHY